MTKNFTKSTIIAAIALLFFSISMTSCCDDPDPKPTPPVVKITHSISGVITAVSGDVVAGATVTAQIGNGNALTATTDARGHYQFAELTQAGTYVMKAQKEGRIQAEGTISIKSTTASVSETWNAQMATKQAPVTVTPSEGGTITVKTETPKGEEASASTITVEVPEGAVTAEKPITITPVPSVQVKETPTSTTTVTESGLAAIVCEPAGTTFDKPLTIEVELPAGVNPSILGTVELYYVDNNGTMTKQSQPVTINANNKLQTTVTHFSRYLFKTVGKASTSTSTTPISVAGGIVDNIFGSKAIQVTDLKYKFKTGFDYVQSVESVLGSGASAADVKYVKTLIEGHFGAKIVNGDGEGVYKVNKTVQPRMKLSVTGTQTVVEHKLVMGKYTFPVKAYGASSITEKWTTADHNK